MPLFKPSTPAVFTDNTTTSGLSYLGNNSLVIQPPSSTSALYISGYSEAVYSGTINLPTPAHIIGAMGKGIVTASGKTIGLVIGVEGTIENNAGTISQACSSVYSLNVNAGTITEFVGSQIQITSNAGTVGNFVGYRSYIPVNQGTITTADFFHVPDMGGLTTTRPTGLMRAFANEDAGSIIYSMGSVLDNSLGSFAPTNGSTSTLLPGVTLVALTPAGTIAGATLAYPSTAVDGQRITIVTTQTITALTLSGGGGGFIGGPSTLVAGGFFTMQKCITNFGAWVRVA